MFHSLKRKRTQVGLFVFEPTEALVNLCFLVFMVGIAFLTYYCFVRPSPCDANDGVTVSDDDVEVCGPRARPFGGAQINDRAREVWCMQEYELGERMNLLTVVMVVGDRYYKVLSVREFLPTHEILQFVGGGKGAEPRDDLLASWGRLCGTSDLVGMQFSSTNMRDSGQGVAAWCLGGNGTLDVRYAMTRPDESLTFLRTIPMANKFRMRMEFEPPRGGY